MKITVKQDFRNQKAGTVYDFSVLKKIGFLTIVGENGCGKSSILQALRGSVKEPNNKSLYRDDFVKLSKNIEIEHDYEKIIFFDAIKDNGNDFMNAYDAVGYMDSGGFMSKNLSHGQSTLMYIHKFMEDNKAGFVPNKTLIVFDEIDHGLSLANQSKFNNFIQKLSAIDKCHVLVVSHNPFFIIQSAIVYDFAEKVATSAVSYVKRTTNFWVLDKVAMDMLLDKNKEK